VNPLDLRGPEFLAFYAAAAAVVLLAAHLVRRWFESGPAPSLREVDPYLVAHLRGGPDTALQVAVLSLLDRGLLRLDGEHLVAGADTLHKVRRPIEQEVLRTFTTSSRAPEVLQSDLAREACDGLAAELRRQGLLPGAGAIALRVLIAIAAVAVLEAVGLAKLQVAAARGHHNVLLLGLLMIVVPIAAYAMMVLARRTTTGNRYLDDLETMFRGLRDRSTNLRIGGSTNELALLLGVFGAPLLGGNVALWTKSLFPEPVSQQQNGSSSSSSCGSGGSCGGGGCGGGCGGCGS
jgi:uncharacterized protein (TIGR04222 family)